MHSRLTCTKSVLGRVRNCVGERALRCEMVASSYVCQPNHNYADFMFRLHSDPTRGAPCGITQKPVATVFTQNHVLVQHLSGIY